MSRPGRWSRSCVVAREGQGRCSITSGFWLFVRVSLDLLHSEEHNTHSASKGRILSHCAAPHYLNLLFEGKDDVFQVEVRIRFRFGLEG